MLLFAVDCSYCWCVVLGLLLRGLFAVAYVCDVGLGFVMFVIVCSRCLVVLLFSCVNSVGYGIIVYCMYGCWFLVFGVGLLLAIGCDCLFVSWLVLRLACLGC